MRGNDWGKTNSGPRQVHIIRGASIGALIDSALGGDPPRAPASRRISERT